MTLNERDDAAWAANMVAVEGDLPFTSGAMYVDYLWALRMIELEADEPCSACDPSLLADQTGQSLRPSSKITIGHSAVSQLPLDHAVAPIEDSPKWRVHQGILRLS